MTKRFILDEYYGIGSIIIDTYNENVRFKHENELSMQQCCDLLNSLAEDNKMLNRMIDKRDGWNNLAHEQLFKLEKENEQLKQQLKIYKNDGLETLNDLERVYENNKKALSNIEKLDKENRELKKQMNRLYNYFMDWHSDEMGGNQFSEMWDIVKESEEWEGKWWKK